MLKGSQSHYLVYAVCVRSTWPSGVQLFRVVIRGYHYWPGDDSVIGFQFPNNWLVELLTLKTTETARVKLILVQRWQLENQLLQFADLANSWASTYSHWNKCHRLIWYVKMWCLQLVVRSLQHLSVPSVLIFTFMILLIVHLIYLHSIYLVMKWHLFYDKLSINCS
jgi:hypothetical protein